jgi:hypothetical protein
MGWSDSAVGATLPVDGVYFNISPDAGLINFNGAAASNSVRLNTTPYYLTASTWYKGTIQMVNTPPSSAVYTLYSADGTTQLWTRTLTMSIPNTSGRDTSPCIIATEGTTDAAANILILDYTRWITDRSLTR